MLPDFISGSNVLYNAILPPAEINNTFFANGGGGYDTKFLSKLASPRPQSLSSLNLPISYL